MADSEKQEKKQKQPKSGAESEQKGGGPPNKGEGKGGGQKRERKPKGGEGQHIETATEEDLHQPAPPARLRQDYLDRIVPALTQRFGYKNRMAVPKLEKIVISMGLGKFATAGGEGKGSFEKAEKELTVIA